MSDAEFDRCARCGALRRDHIRVPKVAAREELPGALAHADVCPGALYADPRDGDQQDNAELLDLMTDDVSAPSKQAP